MHMQISESLLILGLLTVSVSSEASKDIRDTNRIKREDDQETSTSDGLPPEDLEPGPSLGEILGLVALVITILYIIGISWKVIKIYKGEYVPTEPVYLKYK